MTTRMNAPPGVPCWVDLWTSDVDEARRFYGELFGWTAEDPVPEFGGYFSFLREGTPIAGAMGDMGDEQSEFFMPANDTWKIYLATADAEASAKAAVAAGAELIGEVMAVGELGAQGVLIDPTGAEFGFWQASTHPGFTVLDEPGAPSWFEMHTRDFAAAKAFYPPVLGIEAEIVGDSDEFRYLTLNGPSDCGQVAGIMDASIWPAGDRDSYWTVYFCVADVDAALEKVTSLGGSVVAAAEDTPYGRLATVADPMGAEFRLRTPPIG